MDLRIRQSWFSVTELKRWERTTWKKVEETLATDEYDLFVDISTKAQNFDHYYRPDSVVVQQSIAFVAISLCNTADRGKYAYECMLVSHLSTAQLHWMPAAFCLPGKLDAHSDETSRRGLGATFSSSLTTAWYETGGFVSADFLLNGLAVSSRFVLSRRLEHQHDLN